MSHRVVMPHCHIRTLAQVHHDCRGEEAGGWRRRREGHHGAAAAQLRVLLNKAAPRGLDLSLDPDIVVAMGDNFNFDDPDNEFDDDFVMQLAQRWRRGKRGRY